MWKDILLSIGLTIAETIGCKYIDKKKKQEMVGKINVIIDKNFKEFADTSLDCNDFYLLIKSRKFIELIRNFFVGISDGMDQVQYKENIKKCILEECPHINSIEVYNFLNQIEKTYVNYLQQLIEESSGSYALFQLITLSHREIIRRICKNNEESKKFLKLLEDKKEIIKDSDIQLFHLINEKIYGTIRFTGVSGAERKKEQNISKFYIENTFSYYEEKIEKLYNNTCEKIEPIKLENFFDIGNKIILIGSAGLGKTTTLNYLYCNYEKMYDRYSLKVKLDLKEYAQEIARGKKSILWCIAKEFSQKSKCSKLDFNYIQSLIEDYLEKGKCLIILDALDEITTLASRNIVKDKIVIFCELYYLNRVIISTREVGYLENRFDETFLHIKINQFNDFQIEQYSKRWYMLYYDDKEEKDEFWKKFKKEIEKAHCQNIISNPIILVLALVIFDVQKSLPTRRIEFYQKCVETFLIERENKKEVYILEDKTKNIVSVNQVLPKIAYYKFCNIEKNQDYKITYSELESLVYKSIGVDNVFTWATAVRQYIEYLIERTELIQEIGNDTYDFTHKTFYEYFLSCYFCKILSISDEDFIKLLEQWIGSSNKDELARLVIETVAQNGQSDRYDYIVAYLFSRLEGKDRNEFYFISRKMNFVSIIVELYNKKMIDSKFHNKYIKFILYNSKCVYKVNKEDYVYSVYCNQKIQYEEKDVAALFCKMFKENIDIANIMDCLLCLNKQFKKYVEYYLNEDYIGHIISLFDCASRIFLKEELINIQTCNKEIDYFLNEGIKYLQQYPQVFLSTIYLSLMLNEKIDIEKFLKSSFESRCDFYNSINLEILCMLLYKALVDSKYLLIFLIIIVKCLNRPTNTILGIIIDCRKRAISKNISVKKRIEFCVSIWRDLNETTSYEEYKSRLFEKKLFIEIYDVVYRELYNLYIENEKGLDDIHIKSLTYEEWGDLEEKLRKLIEESIE